MVAQNQPQSPTLLQPQVARIPLGYDLVAMLTELARIRDYYSQFPFVRRCAIQYGAPRGNDDAEGMLRNLAGFVRSKVWYVEDPAGFELVTAPDVMLADIVEKGHATGDCDDHVLLLNTLLASVGFQTDFAAVRLSPTDPEYNHVISLALLRGRWVQTDPTAKSRPAPIQNDLFVL